MSSVKSRPAPNARRGQRPEGRTGSEDVGDCARPLAPLLGRVTESRIVSLDTPMTGCFFFFLCSCFCCIQATHPACMRRRLEIHQPPTHVARRPPSTRPIEGCRSYRLLPAMDVGARTDTHSAPSTRQPSAGLSGPSPNGPRRLHAEKGARSRPRHSLRAVFVLRLQWGWEDMRKSGYVSGDAMCLSSTW
ncbi:hypothetical protein FB45DRAFT_351590 [Roridomyces roridus]|uniref:Uncharacterized protein n=1 Tax=Roridomyces roridus TaxID=1738132 RepID=A0AAD7FSG3_9AGAR|nr:hypothetical protein FB45DRAFT_351590 [Roridomyces roridus]